jgi:bifunctional DNA-binding transcriptional regulator/antitoxin component of YhaV-PrlF toxin-antitoxin module
MKAIEFQTTLHDRGIIEIPKSFQKQLQKEQNLRIIVLIEDEQTDDSLNKLVTKQFFEGYSDEDAIYDVKK